MALLTLDINSTISVSIASGFMGNGFEMIRMVTFALSAPR